MALATSGTMSLGGNDADRSVNCELGRSGSSSISMGETEVRDLAGDTSGSISMNAFYGATSFVPPGTDYVGQPFCGGFYFGTIFAAGTCYNLIVAPNSTGCAACVWKTIYPSFTGGTSCTNDGYYTTYTVLDNPTHPAANFTATRTIGGFSDWYLPAGDELAVFYNNGGGNGTGGQIPSGEDFSTTGEYWSTEEKNQYTACLQSFDNGSGGFTRLKCSYCKVRAVRREPV